MDEADKLQTRIIALEGQLQELIGRVAAAVFRHVAWFEDDEQEIIDTTSPDAVLDHLDASLDRFVARVNELETARYTSSRQLDWYEERTADIARALRINRFWGEGHEVCGQMKSSETLIHDIITAIGTQVPTHG